MEATETIQPPPAEDHKPTAAERMAKARAAKQKKVDAPTPAPEDSWDVIEMGVERTALGSDLGEFEPPSSFDKSAYCIGYACAKEGEFGAFPSIGKMEQPERHPEIGLVHPGWRVWKDADGKPFTVKGDKLTLMYCPRPIQDKINAAYAKLGRRREAERQENARRTLLHLPPDINDADRRNEERILQEIQLLEAAHRAA